jgi:F-type H+-transporting ATPase subunit a
MSTSNPSASEYIIHHITNWSHLGHAQDKIVDFNHLNVDTLIWSLLAAFLVILILYSAARKATSGVPGRFQGLVEMMVEMVNEQAKAIIHGNISFIAPLALTAFLFIVNIRQVPPRETFLFFNLEDNQLGKSKTAMYLDHIHLDS